MHIITVCLLNLHEDERMKSRNWKPVAWLPVYDESRDTRPRTGFDSTSARNIRLYHACGLNFLTDGLSALATQLRSLGRMGTLAGLVY
jgi:hypothetical protein